MPEIKVQMPDRSWHTHNTDDMTREELVRLLDQLLEKATTIKTQLDQAKAQLQASGEYADPVWFANAKAALRAYQNSIRKVQRAITKAKQTRQLTLEACFIDVARERLDPNLFQELLVTAQSRVKE